MRIWWAAKFGDWTIVCDVRASRAAVSNNNEFTKTVWEREERQGNLNKLNEKEMTPNEEWVKWWEIILLWFLLGMWIERERESCGLRRTPMDGAKLPVPDSPLVRSHQLRGNLRIHKLRPLPHQERFILFIHHLHKILHIHPADLGYKILLP